MEGLKKATFTDETKVKKGTDDVTEAEGIKEARMTIKTVFSMKEKKTETGVQV